MLELKNFNFSKKNGKAIPQESDSTDIFFNKKKEVQFKNDIARKAILCIILTNILTYVSLKENTNKIVKKRVQTKGMITLNLAIESYTPSNYEGEVKLIGPNNEVITTNARIEDKTDQKADFETKELPIFVVSVKNEDGHKFLKYRDKIIRVFPQSININVTQAIGGPSEINF